MHQRKSSAKTGPGDVDSAEHRPRPRTPSGSKKSFRDPLTFISGVFRFITGVLYVIFVSLLIHTSVVLWPVTVILRWLRFPKPLAPFELVERFWVSGFLSVMGTKVIADGTENVVADPTIFMFTHASNLDPMIVFKGAPVKPKFIFKKSLFLRMPLVFPLAAMLGHIPIDRSRLDSAIKSLEAAGREIVEKRVSIAISPEGTRSRTGELMPFKKGPFHLAKSVGAPITPAVVFNNFNLWRPKQLVPHAGDVRVRFLPQIPVTENDTVEGLSDKVRRAIEDALQTMPEVEDTGERVLPGVVFLFSLVSFAYLALLFLA